MRGVGTVSEVCVGEGGGVKVKVQSIVRATNPKPIPNSSRVKCI